MCRGKRSLPAALATQGVVQKSYLFRLPIAFASEPLSQPTICSLAQRVVRVFFPWERTGLFFLVEPTGQFRLVWHRLEFFKNRFLVTF
jgi:hypothetical protein